MLTDRIDATLSILSRIGVVDARLSRAPPVAAGVVSGLEASLGTVLPDALRLVLTRESGGLDLRWSGDFGPDCRRGHVWMLSPTEMQAAFEDQLGVVREAEEDGLGEGDEGYAALIRDWPGWIPIFRFASGDAFCLDTRAAGPEMPIVLLEHDVMDQGPNLHGLRIASSYVELVRTWSSVLFAEVHDWSRVVGEGGVTRSAPPFSRLVTAMDS